MGFSKKFNFDTDDGKRYVVGMYFTTIGHYTFECRISHNQRTCVLLLHTAVIVSFNSPPPMEF